MVFLLLFVFFTTFWPYPKARPGRRGWEEWSYSQDPLYKIIKMVSSTTDLWIAPFGYVSFTNHRAFCMASYYAWYTRENNFSPHRLLILRKINYIFSWTFSDVKTVDEVSSKSKEGDSSGKRNESVSWWGLNRYFSNALVTKVWKWMQ